MAAPMCTRVLADFGARVIKVENPNGGDFARALRRCGQRTRRPRRPLRVVQPRQGIGHPQHEVAAGHGPAAPATRPGRRVRVQPRARVHGPDGHRRRRPGCRATPTSSPSRSTATGRAGRSRTNARMTFWCRRSRVRVPSPATPACPPSPGPRWPTSPPGCTRRSRSWRCCSRAVAVPRGPPRRPSN